MAEHNWDARQLNAAFHLAVIEEALLLLAQMPMRNASPGAACFCEAEHSIAIDEALTATRELRALMDKRDPSKR